MSIDIACQLERLGGDILGTDNQGMGVALGIDKGRVGMALGAQTLYIDLCHPYLWLERETFTLSQQLSVFINQGIATIYYILRRFAKATRGIDVATHGASTLLSQERTEVAVLANKFGAGREVENDVGTSHREIVARRNGCPHVFAYLHTKLHAAKGLEELGLGRQAYGSACQIDLGRIQVL